MRRRVVITGVGVVSAIGTGADSFWEACLSGATSVAPIPESWSRYADYSSTMWSPLPDIDYSAHGLSRLDVLQNDPATRIAIIAADQALQGGNIAVESAGEKRRQVRLVDVDAERVGVSVGTGMGGVRSIASTYFGHRLPRPRAALEKLQANLQEPEETEVQQILESLDGPPRLNPLAIAMTMPNAAASAISIKFSTNGAANTFCSACAAGTVAVGHAFQSVRSGKADIALAGGVEYMDDPIGAAFRGFDLARTLAVGDDADKLNRPFDRDRSGFLFSEGGAAMLLLEELDHARGRGAPIVAEVAGFAEASDAYNPVSLAADGHQIERVFREAVADAGVEPEEVDYVNAHGTGTVVNDEVETAMLERVVGKRAAVNSTKSLLGHTLGASGALELAVSALSIRDQKTHACRNLEEPIGDLSFVREAGEHRIKVALSESFAFGGHNAAVVLKEYAT